MGAVKHSNTLEFSTFDSVTKEPVKICVVRVSDGVVVCPTGLSATVEEMERTPVIKIISEGKGFRALATEKRPNRSGRSEGVHCHSVRDRVLRL